MSRSPLPVYIYDTRLIHCPEMQDLTSACLSVAPSFKLKCAPVSEILVRLQLPGYAGEHSLRRKGNKDLPVILFRLFKFFCKCIVPVSVQIDITAVLQQRARIFLEHIQLNRFKYT